MNSQETTIPQRALDYLKEHPETAPQFDGVFGEGSSGRILGQAASTPPAAQRGRTVFEVIPQEAIDHLTANPTTAAQFDGVFGKGRAAEVIAAQDPSPTPMATDEEDDDCNNEDSEEITDKNSTSATDKNSTTGTAD